MRRFNVLCLDCEPRADLPPFNAPNMLPEGVRHTYIRLSSQPVPADVSQFSHIVISGSTYSILADEPIVAPLEELVRKAVSLGIPLMGICYGHQMIARALLGRGSVRRASKPEFGWLEVSYNGDGSFIFAPLPNPFRTFVGHFDEICNLPSDWRVIARTPYCDVHAVLVPRLKVMGFQFHPEMDLAVGNACFIADKADFASIGVNVDEIVLTAHDDGAGHVLFERFLTMVW